MPYLTDLAAACRKSGLTVIELPGWQTRGRPASTGGFNPNGVLCHHTGAYDDLTDAANDLDYAGWMARVGRSDLPAPLCNIALSAEGVVYVTAAGRANHGGDARASGPMPAGDANSMYVGIEAMNSGSQGWRGSPGWTTSGKDAAGNDVSQHDAYVRLCAALCDHYGWPATHVRAHRETSTTGKWDPGLLDMDKFRTDIATAIEGEDDMPFTEKQLRDIVREETRKAVDEVLDVDVNANEPKGSARFRGMSLRTLFKELHAAVVVVKDTGKR